MTQLNQRIDTLSPAKQDLLRAKLLREATQHTTPIAIVGMACRFPGASDLNSYWDLISQAQNQFQEIPEERWPVDRLYDSDADTPGRTSAKWACLVDDLDYFDPQFFGITPREASRMDPQQRLLLRCAWQAMEHASIDPRELSKQSTGVFIGVGQTDYSRAMGVYDNAMYHLDAHCGTGGSLSISANRISYVFNFTGPSVAIDTACSSALVAVHQAIIALRRGECQAALVGGVNVCITPDSFISLSKARMLSPTGQCRPFDDSANGYVRGEGCGVLVLKPLTAARRDGDKVLAILRGAATNHGGRTSGITAPNGQAQQQVIRQALNDARVSPKQIGYVEAHGTGTPLGDPIEIESLSNVFSSKHSNDPVYVTSVKANIGHTEIAAGIAGLIKTVLVMEKGFIPPQANLQTFNTKLALGQSRLVIPQTGIPWQTNEKSRFAGVSSFGFGGTNSHVVLECPVTTSMPVPVPASHHTNGEIDPQIHSVPIGETSSDKPTESLDDVAGSAREDSITAAPKLLVISAPTSSGLKRVAAGYRDYLTEGEGHCLGDVCYTAATGRTHFEQRAGIVAENTSQMLEALDRIAAGRQSVHSVTGRKRAGSRACIAALMTGQGSQTSGMGMGLYEAFPEFRSALGDCDALIKEVRGKSLLEVLKGESDENGLLLNQTLWTQPALFAIEYAAARMWQAWGIEFDYLIGHSVGEYAAAAIAEVIDLENAVKLICKRAELMQSLPAGGAMAVLMASEEKVQPLLKDHPDIDIAAVNSPRNTTVAGPVERLACLLDQAKQQEIESQTLSVSHAFHSEMMKPILDSFRQFAAEFDYHEPQIPILSNLTGRVEYGKVFDADYWTDHIRKPVRFFDGAKLLAKERVDITIEMGPGSVLTSLVKQSVPDNDIDSVTTIKRDRDEALFCTTSLAKLHTLGVSLDWKSVLPGSQKCAGLPGFPFAEDSYWFRPEHATRNFADFVTGQSHITPLLGSKREHPNELLFESHLATFQPRQLADHQVLGDTVVPAAAYADVIWAAGAQAFPGETFAIENLTVNKAMFLSSRPLRVQTIVSGQSSIRRQVSIFAKPCDASEDETWQQHATATILNESSSEAPSVDLQTVKSAPVVHLEREEFYDVVAQRGLNYGNCYRMIDNMYRGHSEVVCDISFDERVTDRACHYCFHPALGDAAMQAMVGTIPLERDGSFCPDLYLPVSIGGFRVLQPGIIPTQIFARRTSEDTAPSPMSVQADVVACDDHGEPVAWWRDVRVQRMQSKNTDNDPNDWLYCVDWFPLEAGDTNEPEQSLTNRSILVIGDQSEWSESLAKALSTRFSSCESLSITHLHLADDHDEQSESTDSSHSRCTADSFGTYLQQWFAAQPNPDGIDLVFTHGLDATYDPDSPLKSVAHSEDIWTDLFECLREMCPIDLLGKVGVWFATTGAKRVRGDECVDPCQTAIIGLVQVASQEVRGKNVRLIDLDPSDSIDQQTQSLVNCIACPNSERMMAVRSGSHYVPRMSHAPDLRSGPSLLKEIPIGERFRTRLSGSNTIDSLRFEVIPEPSLEPKQVEIKVLAAGLNFSDILKSMGLYPGITDDVVPLGLECSGVVTAVGSDVQDLQIGDRVLGVVPYGFASHCVTDEAGLVKLPPNLDHLEAAAIPIAFMTAYYCLVNIAKLNKGERVLIHAGAGGVGLAAIGIAKRIGAEVFATAGSEHKRELLTAFGVDHVMSSRTLDFADQIAAITDGQGVDVVLNSLPGEAIDKSLQSLAAYGRFVEIGKTDIYANRPLGLSPFQNNLSYSAVDLDRLFRQRPDEARQVLTEVMQAFAAEEEEQQPLLPFTTFAANDLVSAFRYMSQRKNIGKIVIDIAGIDATENSVETGITVAESEPSVDRLDSQANVHSAQQPEVRSDASYLITGGLGSLGLATAELLAQQQAGGIILLSRRQPNDTAKSRIDSIRAAGTKCVTLAADVCDLQAMKQALADLPNDMPPIRGVIHSAGTLNDQSIPKSTTEGFRSVIPVKTIGTLSVLEAVGLKELDFVLLYSSLSSVLGTSGQANYGLANSFLDGLAERFQQTGPRTLAMNWGAFAGGGMAKGLEEGMASQGVWLLPVQESLAMIPSLLKCNRQSVPVFRGDWSKFNGLLRSLMSGDVQYTLTSGLSEEAASEDDDEMAQFREQLQGLTASELKPKLQFYFASALSEIMGIDPDDIDPHTSLTSLGMDSLMALELGNKMESALHIELPMSIYLQGPSIEKLVNFVTSVLTEVAPANQLEEPSAV